MNRDDLVAAHLQAIERYAEIFDRTDAECQRIRWWLWAGRTLDREIYEAVRLKRWNAISTIEKRVAKANIPSS